MRTYFWKRRFARLLVGCGLLAPSAVFAAPLNMNLVSDPGFEDVDVFDTGPFTSVRLLGAWTDPDGDELDNYSYPYDSNYSGTNPPDGAADYHYTGGFGTSPEEVQISQRIDVSTGPSAGLIAGGNAMYDLSAFFSTYRQQDDASLVRAVFLSSAAAELGSADVGGYDFVGGLNEVLLDNGELQRDWELSDIRGRIPVGTAAVEIQIIAEDADVNHDGYVDLVNFTIVQPADLNGDGIVNAADIDELYRNLGGGPAFDLNADGSVNGVDVVYLVETVLGTSFGDADLSGRFDSGDFVVVFTAGEYEDTVVGNSTWAEGDWNGDREFNSGDLVFVFQKGQYVNAAVADVPEPGCGVMLVAGLMAWPLVRRRRK
jgi:hypothetical protein